MKGFLTYISLIFCALYYSQTARAMVDTTEITIGDQAHYIIQIQKSKDSDTYSFPKFAYKDSLAHGLEILNIQIDTIDINGIPTYQEQITFTAWKKGQYSIPPLVIQLNQDSLMFQTLYLKVNEPDKPKDLNDIKNIVMGKYSFWDWIVDNMQWILIGIIILVVLLLLYLIWKKRKNTKPVKKKSKKKLSAIYVEKLEKLRKENLVESGKEKEFYTRFSAILKEYISENYQLPVQELFTTEILNILQSKKLVTNSQYNTISNLLQYADLAKFAKVKPSVEQSNLDIQQAINWINETYVEPQNTEADGQLGV